MSAVSEIFTDVVCIASWNAGLISQVARPIARGEALASAMQWANAAAALSVRRDGAIKGIPTLAAVADLMQRRKPRSQPKSLK